MSRTELDRLLVTLDVDVHTLAFCELRRGRRLVAPPLDAVMIHYVLQGTMHLEIPGADPVVCGPGSIALIPASVLLHVAADEGPYVDVDAVEHCSVAHDGMLKCDAAGGRVGDLRYVAGAVLASFSGSFGIFDRLQKPVCHDFGDVEIVRHAYRIMLAEIERPTVGAQALVGALMKACLLLLIRQSMTATHADRLALDSLSDPRLSKAVNAVLACPGDRHSVATMAEAAGMSRSSFSRHFTREFSISPMEFVARTRLHHAARLLRSTPIPIKVIAGGTGFASRSHFSRAFKAAYGDDPTAFREKGRQAPLGPPADFSYSAAG